MGKLYHFGAVEKDAYNLDIVNYYYWRTYDGQEIDLIEDKNGKLAGYEMKWSKKITKAPKTWLDQYSNATWEIINKDNYLSFIT